MGLGWIIVIVGLALMALHATGYTKAKISLWAGIGLVVVGLLLRSSVGLGITDIVGADGLNPCGCPGTVVLKRDPIIGRSSYSRTTCSQAQARVAESKRYHIVACHPPVDNRT